MVYWAFTVLLLAFVSILTILEGDDGVIIGLVYAQGLASDIIQITSTSSFIDNSGNFHVIGEVNNTSPQPQTNIVVTTLLSDTNNNTIVGNNSAFSSIGTLRPGELSPFDIIIQRSSNSGKIQFYTVLYSLSTSHF